MLITRVGTDEFHLFFDIFVHWSKRKITAISAPYGDDIDWAQHDVSLHDVWLSCGDITVKGRYIPHHLDALEPSSLIDFESPELAGVIEDAESIEVSVTAGPHRRAFELRCEPPPDHGILVSVITRDENRFLPYFLDHYLVRHQVPHVLVYDNFTQDRDGLLRIIEPWAKAGRATYIPWPYRWRNRKDDRHIGQAAQEAHSLNRFARSPWIGFFDVDELLRIPGRTIPELLSDYHPEEHDGLSFGLRWFMHKGPLEFEDIEDPRLTHLHSKRCRLGRTRQKLFVSARRVRFCRYHWLERGKRDLKIDDTEIFFHHYYLQRARFEKGKDETGVAFDDHMPKLLGAPERTMPRRPASAPAWGAHVERALKVAEREESRVTEATLDLAEPSPRRLRHLLNALADFETCRYRELGAEGRATSAAAMDHNATRVTDGEADVCYLGPSCDGLPNVELADYAVIVVDGSSGARRGLDALGDRVVLRHEPGSEWGRGNLGVFVVDNHEHAPPPSLYEPGAPFEVVIFSRNGALQLEALLSSQERFVRVSHRRTAIFRADDDAHRAAYEELSEAWPEVRWIREGDFRADVLSWFEAADPSSVLMLLSDDMVFIRPFEEARLKALEAPEVLGVSLRLAPHIRQHRSGGRPIVPPKLTEGRWAWRRAVDEAWGRPMSLRGHIFRLHDVHELCRERAFNDPHTLERALSLAPPRRPWMICAPHAVAVKVERASADPDGPSASVSNSRFLAGFGLDTEPLHGRVFDSLCLPPGGMFRVRALERTYARPHPRPKRAALEAGHQRVSLDAVPIFVLGAGERSRICAELTRQGLKVRAGPRFGPGRFARLLEYARALRRAKPPFVLLDAGDAAMLRLRRTWDVPADADALALEYRREGLMEPGALSPKVRGYSYVFEHRPGFMRLLSAVGRGFLVLTERFRAEAARACAEALVGGAELQDVDVALTSLQLETVVVTPTGL